MTLRDLIYVFSYLDGLKIQVCKEDDWDEYDTLFTYSPILKLIENKEVISAAAIEEDVIRVYLKWSD